MGNELYLTELIDVEVLQRIQDGFANMTGMAAITTDKNGVTVTKETNFSEFCRCTRQSKLGGIRCAQCEKMGAEVALDSGTACTYFCHVGLVEFAAPIIANGEIVGRIIGGQALNSSPKVDKFREMALELEIDPDRYVKAVRNVRITSKKQVDSAAEFLYTTANILSDIAYKSYEMYKNNLEIEKAAQMKSDFLANMSHEIRTPMNAVLGMAGLALREEMSPTAREYIHQIQSSGKALLVIINDILDFSKIESGKLNILEVNYEPMSIVNELSNVVSNRIGNKNIEFTMDISHNLPYELLGDNVRIRQVLINLLNNAVKFTKQGEVHLKLDCEYQDSDTIILKGTVSDTGMGIKKEDLGKLFQSFHQLDSKRNRNIEGTGLGLAITKQLLVLMNGTISVESEYEKGSTFYFELPQKIVDDRTLLLKEEKPKCVAVLIGNSYVKKQILKDLSQVGISSVDIEKNGLEELKDTEVYIIEKKMFYGAVEDFIAKNADKKCIVIDKYASTDDIDLPNVQMLRKPIYTYNLYATLGLCDSFIDTMKEESDKRSFTAPEAKILIVDDNTVNLTVAKGLLEPLNMKIDVADGATETIEKVKRMKYDIIFMDHMMPEVDGVETTHIIRRLIPGYSDVPIIALTANAVNGTREMFLREGMNDFVAKPIEFNNIVATIKKWLPKEKIVFGDKLQKAGKEKTEAESRIQIEGLDVSAALALLGSEKLFWTVLEEYYHAIENKKNLIQKYKQTKQWKNYTVEVHSLKSTSKQIGANTLSVLAAALERAGNDQNIAFIQEKNDEMLEEYDKCQKILAPFFGKNESVSQEALAEPKVVLFMLEDMLVALDNMDTLGIDEVLDQMSCYTYCDAQQKYFENLKVAAMDCDIDSCCNIVSDWKKVVVMELS